MKKKLTRIACIAAAAALSCTMFAACGNDGAKTAFTVNGEAMPYGEALFMLRSNQAEVYYQMMSSGFYSSSTLWDDPYTTEDGEETTYGGYFRDSIQHELSELLLMRQKAGEYDTAIDDTDKATTEELAAKYMENNAEFVKKFGITKEQVLDCLQLTALRAKMKEAMTADVDTNVTDEEADMTTITYLRLPYAEEETQEEADSETADTETAEETAAAEAETEEEPAKTNEELRADCEKVLEQFKTAGEMDYDQLNEMADAVNEDFFGMTYSYAPDDGTFSDTILDAVATLQDGEVYDGVIEDTDYYYLVRLDKLHDPEQIETKKEQIVNERKNEQYEEMLHEWLDAADVTVEKVWTDTTVTDNERYLSTAFQVSE